MWGGVCQKKMDREREDKEGEREKVRKREREERDHIENGEGEEGFRCLVGQMVDC